MQRTRRDWMPDLNTMLRILVALLVVLATFAILFVFFSVLGRFRQPVLLFILGAVIAYILAPLANAAQRVLRKRWAAILAVYVSVIAFFMVIGVLLFTPFVQQSQSLVGNLRNPSQASLRLITRVQANASRIHDQLLAQQQSIAGGTSIPQAEVTRVRSEIATLQQEVTQLKSATARSAGASQSVKAILPEGSNQTRIPRSYVDPIATASTKLASDYPQATPAPGAVNPTFMTKSVADAAKASSSARNAQQTVSKTPILVLQMQSWLDDHGIKIDLHQNLGKGIEQINNQAASLLNSVVGILLSVGNLLLDTVLVLIISIYFLSDGGRLIRKAVSLAPSSRRNEAWYYMTSLDRILSGYLRGQLILAALSGLLGGLGAWALGVPYPVLIGISTFVLQLVPVIGPVVLIFPPVVIALIFTPFPTPIFLLVYFLVFEQVVTNIIGPRIIGTAVGIHPLEAMAAALIGFPIAGLMGSFFAVPVVAFLHIIVREAIHHFRHGGPSDLGPSPDVGPQQSAPVGSGSSGPTPPTG